MRGARLTQVSLRPARLEDHPALEELQRRATLAGPYAAAIAAHPEILGLSIEQIAIGQVLVACDADRIVGYSVLSDDEDAIELDGLFVDPSHQRQGVGRMLVAACAAVAGAKGLTVVAGYDALPFYRALGFIDEEEVDTRFASAMRLKRPAMHSLSGRSLPDPVRNSSSRDG